MKTVKLALLAVTLSAAAYAAPAAPSRASISKTYPREYEQWENAMLAGDGKMGIMVFGDPVDEKIIVNDRIFNFPGHGSRTFAEIPADTLHRVRELCVAERFAEANALAVRSTQWRDGGQGGRHPGYLLSIKGREAGEVRDYERRCDFGSGVITVSWRDDDGRHCREAFVSRPDNVSYVRWAAAGKGQTVDCAVSLQMPSELGFPQSMKSLRESRHGVLTVTATYGAPADTIGYIGALTYDVDGGTSRLSGDTLYVSGARQVTLAFATAGYDGTAARENAKSDLLGRISGRASHYDDALAVHKAVHGELFGRTYISLAPDSGESNEELLQRQKDSDRPVAALWQRIFDAGRYHFISSSSELTPPDLLGIWTGNCKAGWGGFYHLDANLNLQVAGGNIGALPEMMEGYFNLIETWRPDLETNARKLLGCRGMLACGNSPGLSSGLISSINDYYPYHYATGEMGWLIYPFWEHWLVTRDREFLAGRILPLLRSMSDFYDDFLQERDTGGKFIFAGSVSPETQAREAHASLVNNSAFDISGARFVYTALLQTAAELGIKGEEVSHWRRMYADLPPYLVNDEGALKEWAWPGLSDNYGHRHSSHLLCVWPFRELKPAVAPALYEAALTAHRLRNQHAYENAGHGLLHASLISAVLRQPESFTEKVLSMLRRDFYYTGLATSHYPDHGTFCTDVAHAMQGIMLEMLVGSDETSIDLLPSLPADFRKGSARGIETRCGVTVETLEWDLDDTISLTLVPRRDCRIALRTPSGKPQTLNLKKDVPSNISLKI